MVSAVCNDKKIALMGLFHVADGSPPVLTGSHHARRGQVLNRSGTKRRKCGFTKDRNKTWPVLAQHFSTQGPTVMQIRLPQER